MLAFLQHLNTMTCTTQAYAEIKEYYKNITINNLDLIREQKAELADLRRREAAPAKQLAVVTAENGRLAELLQKVHKDLACARPH